MLQREGHERCAPAVPCLPAGPSLLSPLLLSPASQLEWRCALHVWVCMCGDGVAEGGDSAIKRLGPVGTAVACHRGARRRPCMKDRGDGRAGERVQAAALKGRACLPHHRGLWHAAGNATTRWPAQGGGRQERQRGQNERERSSQGVAGGIQGEGYRDEKRIVQRACAGSGEAPGRVELGLVGGRWGARWEAGGSQCGECWRGDGVLLQSA